MSKVVAVLLAGALALFVAVPQTAKTQEGLGDLGKQGKLPSKLGDLKTWGIGPVGKIKEGTYDPSKTKRLSGEAYLGCWTENIRDGKSWRCTEQYGENSQVTSLFTDYKRLRFQNTQGDAFMFQVRTSEWDDPGTRRQIIDRIQKEVIPGYVARKTGKTIADYVPMKWVDVKPIMTPEEHNEYHKLIAGEATGDKQTKDGYLRGTAWRETYPTGNWQRFRFEANGVCYYDLYNNKLYDPIRLQWKQTGDKVEVVRLDEGYIKEWPRKGSSGVYGANGFYGAKGFRGTVQRGELVVEYYGDVGLKDKLNKEDWLKRE